MKVLITGIGNIGQTLINILNDFKELLQITEIYALKNTKVNQWNLEELNILIEKGLIICSRDDDRFLNLSKIIDSIDYIFDCNANTFGIKNKTWYQQLPNLIGCSAQGSEKGFGTPFMSNINNSVIKNKKFVQIVSCNTHAIASLIRTFCKNDFKNLIDGDFVVVRRPEDLGNKARLVGANVVSRHLDKFVGTHHAIDVKDLLRTVNFELDIQSSDITTPSQLMHSVRFNIQLKNLPSSLGDLLESNKAISITSKFDSNIIFELGRRYSKYGRLYSQAIINHTNLLIDAKNNRIKGWAFIPQEGNTIISTLHAFLLQTNQANSNDSIEVLQKELIRKEW